MKSTFTIVDVVKYSVEYPGFYKVTVTVLEDSKVVNGRGK